VFDIGSRLEKFLLYLLLDAIEWMSQILQKFCHDSPNTLLEKDLRSDFILEIERPYVARMARLTPCLSTCGSRLLRKGSCDGGLELRLLFSPKFFLEGLVFFF